MLFLYIFISIACFALIIKGADLFVESAVWMAKVTKMPEVLIGATVVSLGTTLPELMVSIISAARGDFGLGVTNAVGSVFCNTALILGVSAAAIVTILNRKEFIEKVIILFVSIALVLIFSLDGQLVVYESIILLLLFIVFLVFNIVQALKRKSEIDIDKKTLEAQAEAKTKNPYLMIGLFLVGVVCCGAGAYFLVESISKIAVDYIGISTSVLGVTIVALGTSLPELITAITAIKKKSPAISYGNVVGANIINATLILGVCGIISGGFNINTSDTLYRATNAAISTAILASILSCAVIILLFVPILVKGRTYKWQGYTLLAVYLGYISYLLYAIL